MDYRFVSVFFTDNSSTAIMSMYIRIKRRNQTMFLHVEPSSSFADIKKRIAQNNNMDVTNIMLVANDKVVECAC